MILSAMSAARRQYKQHHAQLFQLVWLLLAAALIDQSDSKKITSLEPWDSLGQ